MKSNETKLKNLPEFHSQNRQCSFQSIIRFVNLQLFITSNTFLYFFKFFEFFYSFLQFFLIVFLQFFIVHNFFLFEMGKNVTQSSLLSKLKIILEFDRFKRFLLQNCIAKCKVNTRKLNMLCIFAAFYRQPRIG